MTELFCETFLVAFLLFYWGLFLVLLGGGIRGVLQNRRKKARLMMRPEPFRALALSPQTQRN
jgi:hypothetical protein